MKKRSRDEGIKSSSSSVDDDETSFFEENPEYVSFIMGGRAPQNKEKVGRKKRKVEEKQKTEKLWEMTESKVDERIADMCVDILSSPNKYIDDLCELIEAFDHFKENTHIQTLLLISSAKLFTEIVPSHLIRDDQSMDKDETGKKFLSKRVSDSRKYDKTILKQYKTFLRDNLSKITSSLLLKRVSARCFSLLLAKIPHFNEYRFICGKVVSFLMNESDEIVHEAVNGVRELFNVHKYSEAAMVLLQIIHDIVLNEWKLKKRVSEVDSEMKKSRKRVNIRSECIGLLSTLSFPVLSSGGGKSKKKWNDKSEKKSKVRKTKWRDEFEKKRIEAEKELERDMNEISAVIPDEVKEDKERKMLKKILPTYFRIFQQFREDEMLVNESLDGLVKFSPLISMEYVEEVLPFLVKEVRTFRSLITAAKLLLLFKKSIEIDVHSLYRTLFGLLLDSFALNDDSVEACEVVLVQFAGKSLGNSRAAAFVTLLSQLAAVSCVDVGHCHSILAVIHKLLLIHGNKLHYMFESPSENSEFSSTLGTHGLIEENVEFNSNGTRFELSFLKNQHYSRTVRDKCKEILSLL